MKIKQNEIYANVLIRVIFMLLVASFIYIYYYHSHSKNVEGNTPPSSTPSPLFTTQYITPNKYPYSSFDYSIQQLKLQITDIVNRWPIAFLIGNVDSDPTISSPNVLINGSIPSTVYLNFSFPYSKSGPNGTPGAAGSPGEMGPVGPTGPIGPQGYWSTC